MPDVPRGRLERRDEIRARVAERGHVRIDELASEHGVSPMTIHRDLDDLQASGWLRKVRGGATAVPSTMHHGDVAHRMDSMAPEKRALARAAVRHVRPGDSVIVDESTTGLAVADLLHTRAPLTVITHFLALVNRLSGQSGIDLISLGGAYYPAYDAFLGPRTVEAVSSLRASVLISSTTAVTRGHCYHQSQETVAVKRALMAAADRRLLLVDHTKFTKQGLHRLCLLTEYDLVLVDDAIDHRTVDAMRTSGVTVEVVPTDPGVVDAPE